MKDFKISIYTNDFACDVRGDYIDKLKHGKTNEEATQELISENDDIMGDVEEEPLFWFALADTQWNYGRLLPEVKAKALYFLSQDEELERWKESGEKQLSAWKKVREKLKVKLEKPQPDIKKVSKYRIYKCKWNLGDFFAYRFTGDYSKEKGFYGKYVVFRKISEATWWPGHIIPVVHIYKWIGSDIPPIDTLSGFDLLPAFGIPKTTDGFSKINPYYEIELISESARSIPTDNLTYLGNLPGDDIIPFKGYDYWTGYAPVGWESSRYNTKFEHCVIDSYLSFDEQDTN